jgi:hypothetical protein
VAEKDWGLPARHHEEDSSQRTEPPKGHDGTIGSAVDPCDRIFLHNPLHDYESVWWIAIWFVFHCEPKGVADAVMEEARNYAFHDRTVTFLTSGGEQAWKRLPEMLQPLGKVLVKMKRILADAYRSFEDGFDGSGMCSPSDGAGGRSRRGTGGGRQSVSRQRNRGCCVKEEGSGRLATPGGSCVDKEEIR